MIPIVHPWPILTLRLRCDMSDSSGQHLPTAKEAAEAASHSLGVHCHLHLPVWSQL